MQTSLLLAHPFAQNTIKGTTTRVELHFLLPLSHVSLKDTFAQGARISALSRSHLAHGTTDRLRVKRGDIAEGSAARFALFVAPFCFLVYANRLRGIPRGPPERKVIFWPPFFPD